MILEKFFLTFFSVLISEGSLFSNFTIFFLLLCMVFTISGFDSKAFLILVDSLDFLVLYSWISLSTFLPVEFLCLISFLISLIWSEIVSNVNSNWSMAPLVAEESSFSTSFFLSFSWVRRSSAYTCNLCILSFCAKLCCKPLETSSSSERISDVRRCIELIVDVDFLCNVLANLRDCMVLLRIFAVRAFVFCNCAILLEIDFISKLWFCKN